MLLMIQFIIIQILKINYIYNILYIRSGAKYFLLSKYCVDYNLTYNEAFERFKNSFYLLKNDIYYINGEDQELIPINTNPDPNNTVKTAMRKITAYYKPD